MGADKNSICKITPGESLTIYEASALRDEFVNRWSMGSTLVVDLAETQELDTVGVQLLMAMRLQALKDNGSWVVENITTAVKNIFALYNVDIAACARE